jgi:hypothetical protein
MTDEDVQALVVDNGSGMCKVKLFHIVIENSLVVKSNGILFICRLVLQEMMLPEQYFPQL